jgi:hypothetical protein
MTCKIVGTVLINQLAYRNKAYFLPDVTSITRNTIFFYYTAEYFIIYEAM